MSKTKKQMLVEREQTFKKFDYDGTCWTCKHSWFSSIGYWSIAGSCHAIMIRDEIQEKSVTPADSCGLYESEDKR